MNARRTISGTTSVLMEPWRKKSRSARDQVGTWAEVRGRVSEVPLAVEGIPRTCVSSADRRDLSVDVPHEIKLIHKHAAKPSKTMPLKFISAAILTGGRVL